MALGQFVEDRNLLGGHVALVLGDFARAQALFLNSAQPDEALKMHRDLLQWEQAMKLASRFSPKDVPVITREYAQQLEFQCVLHHPRVSRLLGPAWATASCEGITAVVFPRLGPSSTGETSARPSSSTSLLRYAGEAPGILSPSAVGG